MTYYVYDWRGDRVRKVVESEASPQSRPEPFKMQERIYIGDYEVFRKYNATDEKPIVERTTFYATTEYGHMADICSRTIGSDDGVPRQTRFQLHNHLGTATIELDDTGNLLGYEEMFPFGGTSYRAVDLVIVANRFRFSGKELDDENGLYFFGARYYAAWLGRWTAADPVVKAGGGSRYDYAGNSPIRLIDPDGRNPTVPPSGSGGGWLDVPNSSALGTAVHAVALPRIQARLFLHNPSIKSLYEFPTLPGGSARRPYTDSMGEIDLAILDPRIPTINEWVAHVYELKPDSAEGISDAKLYRYQNQTRHYSEYFNPNLPFNLGTVTEARPGTMLEDLERQGAGILDPIEFKTPIGEIRISMRMQDVGTCDDGDDKGHKVNGLILYKVQIRPNKPGNSQQQALEMLQYVQSQANAQPSAKKDEGKKDEGGTPWYVWVGGAVAVGLVLWGGWVLLAGEGAVVGTGGTVAVAAGGTETAVAGGTLLEAGTLGTGLVEGGAVVEGAVTEETIMYNVMRQAAQQAARNPGAMLGP